jgi:hypothetical protein
MIKQNNAVSSIIRRNWYGDELKRKLTLVSVCKECSTFTLVSIRTESLMDGKAFIQGVNKTIKWEKAHEDGNHDYKPDDFDGTEQQFPSR